MLIISNTRSNTHTNLIIDFSFDSETKKLFKILLHPLLNLWLCSQVKDSKFDGSSEYKNLRVSQISSSSEQNNPNT